MDTRKLILEKYGVASYAPIGRGMEAEVYARSDDTVLKLYAGTAAFNELITLKDFYHSLARDRVPYALPQIYAVAQEDDHIVTVEWRLRGRPLSTVLGQLSHNQLDAAMQEYLTAVLALADIAAPDPLGRFKLFDPHQLSNASQGDWHQFLLNYLQHKLGQVAPYLERDVPAFARKRQALGAILASPYAGDYKLIHGDFCPGNLLLDEQHRAAAVIDFGLFTMFGDPLFDAATSWVFFDLYDELQANVYDRLLAMLLEVVGADKRGLVYRYVLIYCILSANTYSADCADGHYQWCVANLANQHLWNHLS